MLRKIAALVALIAIVASSGCGGGGSSTPSNSPFVGSYTGTFSTTNPQSGTLALTVGSNGSLTGSAHNNTTGQNATISGNVTNAGAANVAFAYPSFSASASGTVAFAQDGHLKGTLSQSTGGSVTIDLIKQ